MPNITDLLGYKFEDDPYSDKAAEQKDKRHGCIITQQEKKCAIMALSAH